MGAERFQRPGKEAAGSRHEPGVARQAVTAAEPIGPPTETWMEEGLRRENRRAALKRVQANQGAPGVDGMTVDELPGHLRKAWPALRAQWRQGTDVPAPVRAVQLPKPGGGGIDHITAHGRSCSRGCRSCASSDAAESPRSVVGRWASRSCHSRLASSRSRAISTTSLSVHLCSCASRRQR